ncbi:MAG: hypothetical protein NT076_03910, partial [Candidatus Pacearchaeota archaeon]|nr:hypothetical protein [Candidatus Pacearchaeota archaeon]
MFDFLKKKDSGVPDVGQEDRYEEEKKAKEKKKEPKEEAEEVEEEQEEEVEQEVKEISRKNKNTQALRQNTSEFQSLALEKINARIEAMDSLIKGYSERFSNLSERLGEIRTMSLNNEKEISKIAIDSSKAVDIVKEVQPEKLRTDYLRVDSRIQAIEEKIEANKQFYETIMNEVKDLRQKAGIFVGTDALLKLNDEVKKDLIEIQKMSNRVRINTDKSESIFIELKRTLAENEKLAETMNTLDSSYSGVRKELDKLKLDYSSIVKQDELSNAKKDIEKRIIAVEIETSKISEMADENRRLSKLIETMFLMMKKNKEEIADVALTIGDSHIKKVGEYDEKLNSILKIIDELAGQINTIKNVLGISKEKIEVKNDDKKIVTKNEVRMKNID